MSGIEWWLELALASLMCLTLVHAVRLQRALTAMRRDRGELEGLLSGLDEASRQAQGGVDGLRASADLAVRGLMQRTEAADSLREDLAYLVQRAEAAADRLETLIRAGRSPEQTAVQAPVQTSAPASMAVPAPGPAPAQRPAPAGADPEAGLRSQAERDLLKALRGAR